MKIMIRTRDFLVFSGALVFLLSMITATVATDALGGGYSQVASVASFAGPAGVSGAESPSSPDTRAANISRLKNKIAAGEGDVSAGEPIFTSVDTITATTAVVLTDQTPDSVWIGHTLDGQPLMSGDMWRFVGFGSANQIGVALNDRPIFGPRADDFVLDACGGVDEGLGYRFHFQPGKFIDPACYSN